MMTAPTLAQERASISLEEQLALFLEWFPGRYDNGSQMIEEMLSDVPEQDRNYHRHSIFRRVDLPQFGDVVFYAEQYRDYDPEKIYRQRIYVFTLAPEENAFRLRVHIPNNVEALRGAYRDLDLLVGLNPDDTTTIVGCDLFWRWDGTQFRGDLKPGACRFQSEAFGQEVVLEEYLLLDPDSISFADRGLAVDGTYLFGMRGDRPTVARRVRPFLCTYDNGETEAVHWAHDQGMSFSIPPEGEGGNVALYSWRWKGITASDEIGQALIMRWTEAGSGVETQAASALDAQVIGMEKAGEAVTCRHAPDALYDDRP